MEKSEKLSLFLKVEGHEIPGFTEGCSPGLNACTRTFHDPILDEAEPEPYLSHHSLSGSKEALHFIGSAEAIDVLITDLDLSLSQLGGCNIARDVRQRFPESLIYVFTNGTGNDHRMMILRSMKDVHFLSKPFGVLFLAQKIKEALKEREGLT